jgi:hypothetical protein
MKVLNKLLSSNLIKECIGTIKYLDQAVIQQGFLDVVNNTKEKEYKREEI